MTPSRSYLLLAFLTAFSIAQPLGDNHCHSDWIENDDLHPSCVCEVGNSGTCHPRSLGTCNTQALTSKSELESGHGNEGCTEANYGCNSCYLWFDSVCNLLKDGKYDHSPSGLWVRLNDGKVTSKKRMPGILELSSEEIWEWGQTLADSSHALVINSVKARKQEQIHMHVCDVKTGSKGVRDILGDLKRSDYTDLTKVPKHNWLCRVEAKKYAPITGVTADIKGKTLKDGDCANLIGAAVLTDSHDYTWMCLTTGLGSTQGDFCK